jgi:phospholipid transport system substrate-binding protein
MFRLIAFQKFLGYRLVTISKNILFGVVIGVAFCNLSFADDNKKIVNFVNNKAAEIIKVIESQESKEQKQENLTAIFNKSVDITWMGKFALGKYYRQLDEQKLEEYLSAYKDFLTHTYVSKFTEYNGQSFYIESVKFVSDSQYIVSTKVNNPQNSAEQITIAYRMKENDNDFQIRDIIAEGISLILGQRSEFNSIISKEGIDSLIQRLKNKVK